jgi:hypothetical protein
LGTLTYDPAPNVRGVATVTVTVKDDGGTASGGVDSSSTVRLFDVSKPHPWHNFANSMDVVGSGTVTPDRQIVAGDALAIINYINGFGAGPVPANAAPGLPFGFLDTADSTGVDVADNFIAPNDALAVINAINGGQGGEGEPILRQGENFQAATDAQPISSSAQSLLNELIGLLAIDVASQSKRRNR